MQPAACEPGRNSSKNSSSRGHCGHRGLAHPSEHPALPPLSCPVPAEDSCFDFKAVPHICCAPVCLHWLRVGRCGHATKREVWAARLRRNVPAVILLQVQISWQPLSVLLLCLCFPLCKSHESPQGCSSVAGGQRQREQGREAGRGPCSHLQAIRTVLWALNCSRFTMMTTSVRISRLLRRLRLRRTSLAWRVNWMQLSAGEAILSLLKTEAGGGWEWRSGHASTLNPVKRQLLLWDVLRWPAAAGRDSTSSSVPKQPCTTPSACQAAQ